MSRIALGLLLSFLLPLAAMAQPVARGGAQAPAPRRASAARVSEAPAIDGVLDERVWQQATPLNEFVQAEPMEGQPATESTEVRLLYDDTAIYVGVVCHDEDPTKIITTDSRRDSGMNGQDSFQMIFDTYHDRQNGFVFGTNAAGVEYDAQVRNEGEVQRGSPLTLGRFGGGSGGGLNVNWDGSWEVKTRITDTGWTAEFRIPLRTLRYGPPPQVWGVNFARTIERKREEVFWSPIARIYNITRLSSAGELRDLNVAAPRNIQVIPYASGSLNRNFTPGTSTTGGRDWGVDAKVGVTTSLNLDLTYNTDFAQVEVDEQQINLTRFNLLFPEKRPFFLENRGLFAVGRSGEIDLFFSRRIGITEEGTLVPIRGGARLSGKMGGVNLGLLNMQTEQVGCGPTDLTCAPANNYGAVRVSKDLLNRSSVGGIFVNRTATGGGLHSDGWNRTWGVDGKLGIRDSLTFNGFAARTETPGLAGREHAFSSGVEYETRTRRAFFEFTEMGEDFNPEVGFLQRPDGFRQIWTGWRENVRTEGLRKIGVREWGPHFSYDGFWGFDGFQETATLHLDQMWDFEKGGQVSTALNIQYEGLREPFEIYPGVVVPSGSYRSPLAAGMGNTDRRKWISAGLAWNVGGFLSGNQTSLAPTLTIRKGGRFQSSLRWTRNDIDLPEGAFVTNLGSLRTTYNFSTRMSTQALIQYNDRTRRWSSNVRFNWQRSAATGLYVVYNDTELFDGLGPFNRAFIVKYSHLIDVLR